MSAARQSATAHAAVPHLEQLVSSLSGVVGVILASSDGFELGSAGDSWLAEAQLAGMSSTMQGLGEAMARNSGLDSCRDIIIDSESGRIVLMSVPDVSPTMVLMAIITGQSAFGQVLLECRQCCVAISNDLGDTNTGPDAVPPERHV